MIKNTKKKRNHCLKLIRISKRNFFERINERDVTNPKKFWKVLKPCLSNKSSSEDGIVLIENGVSINDQRQLADIFNKYYGNLVKTLELPNPPSEEVNSVAELSDLQMCKEKF